jgi:hypothetical protein
LIDCILFSAANFHIFFCQGEAFPSVNLGPEKADTSSGFVGLEQSLQMLKAVPFFYTPLQPSDEEKIRVSVHNYTRALKRNRGTYCISFLN